MLLPRRHLLQLRRAEITNVAELVESELAKLFRLIIVLDYTFGKTGIYISYLLIYAAIVYASY